MTAKRDFIRIKSNKLGHLAPKGYVVNRFNSIDLNGDFAYCKSHNFIYHPDVEEQKLYNGLPCHYTDGRYIDTCHNYFHSTHIHWTRFKDISLKACIRKTLGCRNIPVGTTVVFSKSWYFVGKKIRNSYQFKVRKENRFNPDYQINLPEYRDNFSTCEYGQNLVNKLRENGFIVRVERNTDFIGNMLNTAILHTGRKDFVDNRIEGEIAIAYGYGMKIGFSSYDNDFMGYHDGCENILFDFYGEFDKWSRCRWIDKKTNADEVINELLAASNMKYKTVSTAN